MIDFNPWNREMCCYWFLMLIYVVQILNLTESWEAYKGDKDVQRMAGERMPLFKATKNLGSHSCTVSMFTGYGVKPLGYRMNWSRDKEWSKIYQAAAHTPVAEVSTLSRKAWVVRRMVQLNATVYWSNDQIFGGQVSRKCGSMPKKLLDKDVLTLRVQPGMDQALAMAMIMITNSMRWSQQYINTHRRNVNL